MAPETKAMAVRLPRPGWEEAPMAIATTITNTVSHLYSAFRKAEAPS